MRDLHRGSWKCLITPSSIEILKETGCSVADRETERISTWLVQIPFQIYDVFELLISHMKIFGSAFVGYRLKKVSLAFHSERVVSLRCLSWGYIFSFLVHLQDVEFCMFLFKESDQRGSNLLPHSTCQARRGLKKEHPCCSCNSFNEPLSKQVWPCLENWLTQ